VDLFKLKNSAEKEIWYISAPASLPITALQEVSLGRFAKQQPIMTHDGAKYALVSDPAARDATRVLLPDKGKNGYEVLSAPVNHVLQFQQVLDLQSTATTGISKSSSQVLQDTTSATKPKKAQPKGMKMRFRPSGFGPGDLGAIGSSDEEVVSMPPTFRQPHSAPNGTSAAKKRRENNRPPASKMIERQKYKEDKSKEHMLAAEIVEKNADYVTEATTAIDADQATAPPEARAPEGKKKKKKDKHGMAVAIGMAQGDVPAEGDVPGNEEIAAAHETRKEKKDKKKRDKKRKEAVTDVEDVSMPDAHVPAEVKHENAAVGEIKDKKEKNRKNTEAKATWDGAQLIPGGMANGAEVEISEKKKKKKDKEEKKKQKLATDRA
jgi:hypothetical protein